jgi:predicted nuclease of predicted toxin-antitoxin system
MKLLFDQNLSPSLPRLLRDLYVGSTHVRDIGFCDADDTSIWEYAEQHGFAIVSKRGRQITFYA